jgi:hypothetical protein
MMRRISSSLMLRIYCGIIVVLSIASTAWAGPCFKCKHEPVVMPVSLAAGTTVRTPEFLVKNVGYTIRIRVNRSVPFDQLSCMIGGNQHPPDCGMYQRDSVIEAEWKVWDGDRLVVQGTAGGSHGDMAWSSDIMDRYLGQFDGEANKKYVVEVKFIKDGTPLNKFNPRLVVRMFDTF